jgi:DNA-binding LacI/PurR family transcriptional regulator
MADVARRAGVSPTTVSFVINDRPNSGIPGETRERVLTAVRDLGYRPNRQASNLRLQRTRALGYHVTEYQLEEQNVFALSFLQPLLRAADRRGHQIVAFTSKGDSVGRFADLVAGHVVDGFLLGDTGIDDPRARYLAEAGVPFAAFGRTAPDLPQSWVDIDNRVAMHQVVDHLVGRGHRRIAFATGAGDGYWLRERAEAVAQRLTDHRLTLPPDRVARGAPAQVQALLAGMLAGPDRPTAVITAGDTLAVQAYRAVRDAGLRVGADVAVTGFDPLLWMMDPALTTLTVPFGEVADALVARCLTELDRGPTGEPGAYVPTHFVVRDSG